MYTRVREERHNNCISAKSCPPNRPPLGFTLYEWFVTMATNETLITELVMSSMELAWGIIITIMLPAIGTFIWRQADEVSRINVLLNRTREDYIKRIEHSDELNKVTEHLIRLENKIDRMNENLFSK